MAAGYRGQFGFWVGGLSGNTPPATAGYQALPGFWLGGFHGDTGVVTVPPPTVPPPGGGEAGRGAKGGRRRKRIEWLPPDYDLETGEPLPRAELPVRLTKPERKVARLLAQYRGRDDDTAERAREQLEALRRAEDSVLARFIARQQAFDEARRRASAEDDEAAVAFMQWMLRNP